jgi:type IV pilus assembly protein PilE
MSPRIDSARRNPRGGYTLIELLVVVVFIAILATIALNRFRNVSRQSIDATIKSDIRNALSAEEEYYVDAGAYVPFSVTSGGSATELGFQASPGVSVTATLEGTGVKIVGSHPGSTESWCLSTATSEIVSGTSC